MQNELLDPMPRHIAALRDSAQPVWVFAYGSLIWDPDFSGIEAETALLRGYHRSFCLYSYDYRGTRTRPGLTLGLDRGGACQGIALRLLDVRIGDVFVLRHLRENAVSGLGGAFGMAVGDGVIVGGPDKACQKSAFLKRQLAQIFAEIGDAGFRKSA